MSTKENKIFTARLTRRECVAESTFSLEFSPIDNPLNFTPGQYVWIKVQNLLYPDPKGEQRAFTIVSSSLEGTFRIIFRESQSGFKKTLLEIPIDSVVSIIGPCGSFYPATHTESENKVFVAEGIGIASFLSSLHGILQEQNLTSSTHLIYIETDEKYVLPEVREIQNTLKDNPHLKIVIHIGAMGDDFVQKYNFFERNATWYISGSLDLVSTLSSQLLSIGITKDQMKFEDQYPYFPYERKLELSESDESDKKNIYKLALDDALTLTVITDINGRILYANNATSEISGYSLTEILQSTPRLWGGLMDRALYAEMWRMIKDDRMPFVGKVKNRKKSGEQYIAEVTIVPILDPNGDLMGFYSSEKNITEIERIDKAKTEFVSLVSHQLRTPLSSVNWFSEMLLAGDAGEINEEQKKYIEEIYSGNQRMVELVNDLLDVSRLDLGTFAINLVPTDLVSLAESVITEQIAPINEKKIKLIRMFPENLPSIAVDLKLMRMVLQNLFSNAIKYTPPEGTVEFSLGIYEEKNILIRISDNGYGIPKHEQKDVFSKLFRADNVKQMDVEGTGLGLYIVRAIVEGSNGKIWFESEEKIGTTFFVVFPLDGMKKLEKEAYPF